MKHKGTVVALGLCLVSVPLSGGAEPLPILCGAPGALVSEIEKRWGELPAAFAVDVENRLVILLINPENGSWSMIRAYPDGRMCIDLTGAQWETLHLPTVQPQSLRARLYLG